MRCEVYLGYFDATLMHMLFEGKSFQFLSFQETLLVATVSGLQQQSHAHA